MRITKLSTFLIALEVMAHCTTAQTPFSCSSPLGYVTAGNSGTVTAHSVNLSTGTGSVVASNFYNGNLNAIGYNITDNYIWGKIAGASSLARIDGNWVVNTFPITGLTNGLLNVGDVSSSGVLFMANGNSTGSFSRVDVNPASGTYLQLLSTIPANASGYADIAFNPSDGFIYTVQTNLSLLRINPGSGVITQVGTLSGGGISMSTSFGVVFFDASGTIFIGRGNGDFYKVANVASGATTAQYVGNSGAVSGTIDAARCAIASVPLPVILLDFSVVKKEQTVLLNWTTREDSHTDHFEIQRSADGINWDKIGLIDLSGTGTKSESDYTFRDELPLRGNNNYRLRIMDKDGSSIYSAVRRVNFNMNANEVRIYPNPAKGKVHIEVSDWNNVRNIMAVSIDGRTIVTIDQPEWNPKELTSGFYFVKILFADNNIVVRKVLIDND